MASSSRLLSEPDFVSQLYTLLDPATGKSRFINVRIIGKGGQGFVAAAHDLIKGQEVALKILDRQQVKNKYSEREIINHSKLRHPHIIRLDELLFLENSLVILMEYANQGDLHNYVFSRQRKGGLDEDEARSLAQQLFLALHYTHQSGIANRDIKLENILLAGRPGKKVLVKLADFGFSKDEHNHSAPTSRLGTMHYCAPEILVHGDITEDEFNNNNSYNAKQADMWSCGVVLYAMLMQSYPFESPEDKKFTQFKQITVVMKRVIKEEFSPPAHLSEDCQDLLSKLLSKDPNNRPTSETIWQHPWVKKGLKIDVVKFNDNLLASSNRNDDEIVENIRNAIAEAAKMDQI